MVEKSFNKPLVKKPPTKDEVDAAVGLAPSTDDETNLAKSDTKVEPQIKKNNTVSTPQEQDFEMNAATKRKRASDDILGDKPTTVEDARKLLNLGGGDKVAGAASSRTNARRYHKCYRTYINEK